MQWILPEPYNLFDPELYEKSPLSFDFSSSPCKGVELFSKVASYHSAKANRAAWKSLLPEQREIFENPPEEVNVHLHRLAHGYSTATYSQNETNPYYDAWLYPWEIIKDKLRMQWMFGADIYDSLILEALGLTKAQVTPKNLFASDNEAMGIDEVLAGDLSRSFRRLLPEERAEYEARSTKKTEFCNRLRLFNSSRKLPQKPFQTFFKSQFPQLESPYDKLSVQEKSKYLSQKWQEMSEPEKSKYEGVYTSAKGRIHREKILDDKTELVMDYIFEVGQVENWTGDWRKWRRQVAGEMHYLDKIYFPYVVQKKWKGIEMQM